MARTRQPRVAGSLGRSYAAARAGTGGRSGSRVRRRERERRGRSWSRTRPRDCSASGSGMPPPGDGEEGGWSSPGPPPPPPSGPGEDSEPVENSSAPRIADENIQAPAPISSIFPTPSDPGTRSTITNSTASAIGPSTSNASPAMRTARLRCLQAIQEIVPKRDRAPGGNLPRRYRAPRTIPAPTVSLVASSIRMKLPVVRLRR